MKPILTFSLLLLSFCFGFSQVPSWQWAYSHGGGFEDWTNAICTDDAGNSFVAGTFEDTCYIGSQSLTTAGGHDILIARFDANGNCIWARAAGGIGDDFALDIEIDPLGFIYVTGYFYDTANFGPIHLFGNGGLSSCFLAKYDLNGTIIWARHSEGSAAIGRSIALDLSGNAYITGILTLGSTTFGTFTLFNWGSFAAKYDPTGTVIYATKIGEGFTNANCIDVDNFGNAYVTGYFQSSEQVGTLTYTSLGLTDPFLVKLNSTGHLEWMKHFGSPGSTGTGHSICTDPQNNIFICGEFQGDIPIDTTLISTPSGLNETGEAFIVRFDTGGTVVWALQTENSYSNPFNNYSTCRFITCDNLGNIYLGGGQAGATTFGTINMDSAACNIIAVMDILGNFSSVVCTPAESKSLGIDANGNIYVTGILWTPATFGNFPVQVVSMPDFYIAKLSALPTQVTELEPEANFIIFPNPSRGNFTIKLPQDCKPERITVFNSNGQLILNETCAKTSITLDLAGKPKGIYFLNLHSADQVISRKIVLE